MKVLHIVSWFPNKENPKEALWIKRHIDALQPFCDNEVFHIRTIENSSFFSVKNYTDKGIKHHLIYLPTKRWFIVEIVTFFQLFFFAIGHFRKIQNADIINWHIAYPNLTFSNILKPLFPKPWVITEHWSAYHFNFGVKKTLSRVQRIFKQDIPVITVSDHLRNDIKRFSNSNFPSCVIPNLVDGSIFSYDHNITRVSQRFFMVSQWQVPKDPVFVINTFAEHVKNHSNSTLFIGGYGKLLPAMKKQVERLNLTDHIFFLGKLSSEEIAQQMNLASAFIHLSDYETFSVVCAEAISCGCPVICMNVGGPTEFINETNGILLDDKNELVKVLNSTNFEEFNRNAISNSAAHKFSSEQVGKGYYRFLKEIINGRK